MSRPKVSLTPPEFERISRLVHSRSGLELPANRQNFVEMRLAERFEELGLTNVGEYIERLILGAGAGAEFLRFIESLVVQETFFFRHGGHFRLLRERVVPEALREGRGPSGCKFRIWSAGCANGAEPYSLALDLCEALPPGCGWTFEVLATDISSKSLDEARVGRFSERMLKHVPPGYLSKYFVEVDGVPIVSDAVKALVKFQQHNLMEGGYPGELDAIFCRNVLIYFDAKDREKIVNGFHAALRRPGYLFLGHSETLRDFPNLFETIWHDGSFAYRWLERRGGPGAVRGKRTTLVLDLLRKSVEGMGGAAAGPPTPVPAPASVSAAVPAPVSGVAVAPVTSASGPGLAAAGVASVRASGSTRRAVAAPTPAPTTAAVRLQEGASAGAPSPTPGAAAPRAQPPPSTAEPARRRDDIHVVSLEGVFDAEASANAESPLTVGLLRVIQEGPRQVIVNLDGVTYLDAGGTALIHRVVTEAEAVGGRVRLVSANPSVRRWLEKPQYAGIFVVCRTETEARATLVRERGGTAADRR
ncbi:MAG: STAS domain-containing protein [Planctomycetes bacterium]|nr:STAS domain-containing protein [Planctomycetota bacterium]